MKKTIQIILIAALIFSFSKCTSPGNRKQEKTLPDQASDRAKEVLSAKFDTLIIKNKGHIHEDKLVPKENKKFDKKWSPVQQGRKPRKNPHAYPPPTPTPTPTPTPIPVGQVFFLIDFDGANIPTNSGWNGGQAFYCKPSVLPVDERKQSLYKMQNVYNPFNAYISDSQSEFDAWVGLKHIVVVHPETVLGYAGYTGVAQVGSALGGSLYSFVFEDRLFSNWSYIADIMIHENGHASGLNHQSDCSNGSVTNTYSNLKWMGYCFNLSAWVVGTRSYDCSIQDDVKILSTNLGTK